MVLGGGQLLMSEVPLEGRCEPALLQHYLGLSPLAARKVDARLPGRCKAT